jgi:Zn finger protein HypA/HybF involved in hydrogenase expression
MRYHAPSIPAIECSPQIPDNTPVLICPSCGDTMQHLRTIPKLGARLEQFIFVCPSCEQVETKEVKRGGVRQPHLAPVY